MTVLPGIGPQLARLVERVAGANVVDLLWHLPTGLVDRRAAPQLKELHPRDWPDGSVITVKVRVERHQPGIGRRPYRVFVGDAGGSVMLVYFNVKGDYLNRLLPVGAERVISGKVEDYNGQLQMSHPDHIAAPDDAELAIESVYGLTAGLSLKMMRKSV